MRYRFDGYILDTQRYELSSHGKAIKLRPKVFEVLHYLIRHRERVVSKEELLEQLWPHQFIADGTLNACVMAVRKAIGDSGQGQRRIQTFHGRGYRFVAAVEEHEPQPSDRTPRTAESATQGPAVQAQELMAPPAASEPPLIGHTSAPALSSPQEPSATAALEQLHQEHKQVTVLCCGLKNAAALAKRVGDEAMHQHMQAFLARVQTRVERYGGSMIHYGVDGCMALFGAPIAHEDHARQAVLAALALQQAPSEAQHAEYPAIAIGVHTGPVVVGNLGHGAPQLYTAMGETIQLATSLQRAAAAGDVLISSATYRLVQEEVQGEAWEAGRPGTGAPAHGVYRVHAVVQRRAGVPERQGQPRSPFVGRAHELAILHERLAQAERGQGQVIGITGEAGIGKSRLLAEFWHAVQGRPLTRLTGQCLPYGQTSPYLPVLSLLRQRCQIADGDAPEMIRTKVYAAAQEAEIGSEADIALLLQLLDVSVEAALVSHDNPSLQQAHTFALLRQLIMHGRRQPCLLFIEDVHWIDASSEAWLATVVAGLAHQPLLLVVTYRPGYQPSWLGQSYATQLALPHLSAPESLRLVQAVSLSASVPAPVQQAIIARAAGNAFFLQELTWSVREHDHVDGSIGIPDTIQSVLAARIDRIPPAPKRLLQLAAVIGTEVGYPLLHALAGVPEDTLGQHLSQLQAAELLSEVSSHPAAVYTFTHALLQEVAYQSLLTNTRRIDHERLAHLIESQFPEQAESHPSLLAHHYTEAGMFPQAIAYWLRAGAHAFQRGAHQESIVHLKRGLALLEEMPESDARQQLDLDLNLTLGPICMVTQGVTAPEVERVYQRASRLCDERTQVSQRFAILRGLHHMYRTQGHLQRARECAEQLLALAQVTRDETMLLEAQMSLGMVLVALGEFAVALDHLDQGLTYREAATYPLLPDISHPAMGGLFYSGFALWYLGYPEQAQARVHEGLEMAQHLLYPHHVIWGQHLGASFFQLCRDVRRTRELADAVVLGTARHGLQICRLTGLVLQGWTLVQAGQEDAGIAQIQQGLTESRRQSIGASLARYCALLAEVYGDLGRGIPGLALIAEAQASIKRYEERTYAAEVLRLRGELLLTRDGGRHPARPAKRRHVEVEKCFQQAMDLARSQQAKMLELRAALSLSRLWQQQGRRHEAQQLLAGVYSWFTEGFDSADLQEAQTLLTQLQA
jgi:class 3 adenylate cyclase/DNA-binding winged helix-turn-helix (wHTH) protein/tetratricopeptide (TPR) repeat protein